MTFFRLLALVAILFTGTVFSASCGRPQEGGESGAGHATAPRGASGATSGNAQGTPRADVQGFQPELLLSDRRTSQFRVELPVTAARLSDPTSYMAQVQIVVECADAQTRGEVESKKNDLSVAVGEVLAGKNLAFVSSTAGKLQLQEEIVARLKQKLTNQGVKQVYYRTFAVERGR